MQLPQSQINDSPGEAAPFIGVAPTAAVAAAAVAATVEGGVVVAGAGAVAAVVEASCCTTGCSWGAGAETGAAIVEVVKGRPLDSDIAKKNLLSLSW